MSPLQRNTPQTANACALPHWDVFCSVIDNYGDIGVAWRLARQLVAEHGVAVRLWVDAPDALQAIWPQIDASLPVQTCAGVEVRRWDAQRVGIDAADVVIAAFGCTLDDAYLAAMAARVEKPVWINLEYLTAEVWAGAHHALPSPHPVLPLVRHFFFPGYRADTGGLLREAGLVDAALIDAALIDAALIDAALIDAALIGAALIGATRHGRQRDAYWRAAGVAPDAFQVSLFAYDNPALSAVFDAWAHGAHPVVCHVPEGRILPRVAGYFGGAGLKAGDTRTRGALSVRVLPFLRQDAYDALLWACDANFVRGEDSCVRAQWAGQPFVWQAYPQDADAHRDKLCALFELHADGFAQRDALHSLWLAWNGFAPPELAGAAWQQLDLDNWARHCKVWRTRLATQTDLASQLVAFACGKMAAEIGCGQMDAENGCGQMDAENG